ncbi:MAG: hypothetical protein ACI3XJ_12635 [Oscillospiraceae bacterium]
MTVSRSHLTWLRKAGINCETGDTIDVPISVLPKTSRVEYEVVCDYCGREYMTSNAKNYRSSCTKHACPQCNRAKARDVMMEKYGVTNPFELPEIQERIRQTNIEKYGVANPAKLESVKEKMQQTMIERYGAANPMQSDEIKSRVRKTCLEKYGVINPSSADVCKEKRRNTMLERYGADCSSRCPEIHQKIEDSVERKYGVRNMLLLPEVRQKAREGMIANGSQQCSKAQRHIHELLGGELNYPYRAYFIDIAKVEEKIAIEYDGSGHDLAVRYGRMTPEKFHSNEVYRWKQLYEEDWRIITFKSTTDKLPSDDILLRYYNLAKAEIDGGRHWATIDLDNFTLQTSQKIQTLDISR